jgi:ATP-dependent DNA helicase DinG
MDKLELLFADDGPLSGPTGGYRLRPQQLAMAQAIAAAIEHRETLVAEAGTGTGKTYAYLIPALLAGGKVIISTGTKTLQDQLFNRDLPVVREALGVPVTTAMLKGRANYICHYHLARAREEGRFYSREDAGYLPLIERFARHSDTGDKSELGEVPEDASIWPLVTSTRDNCLGQECPFHKECFVLEARKRALEADVVVVNHHLFFADVMLRDEGVAELLPASNTVIFDEAHQLPETASLFFGESLATSQFIELARDIHVEAAAAARDFAALPKAATTLDKAARDLRLVFPQESIRLPAQQAEHTEGFAQALTTLKKKLDVLTVTLETQAERSPGLQNCLERAQALGGLLAHWQAPPAAQETSGTQTPGTQAPGTQAPGTEAPGTEAPGTEAVRWVEVYSHSLQLHVTPLSIARIFERQLNSAPRAWIFTSATLAVKNDFRHYQEQMGLAGAKTALWESPFDYARQALLYVPRGLPAPNAPGYTQRVIEAALPVLKAAGGRAFVLFTSLRAMREGHSLLKEAFARDGLEFPLLLQGEGARSQLLDRFRALGNAVLVASQSFWEGVDVRGDALSLVIIDKLPFSPPDDPVLAARIDELNRQGKNAFMEHQLPHAVITLKQGAGRLIRDANDRGVLMICDPRLVEKSYGRRIWQSLPPMKRSRELAEVEEFFALPAGMTGLAAGPAAEATEADC